MAVSSEFDRSALEAAMDAYDDYLQSSKHKHGEIFDSFGKSFNYWVRSTRKRPDPAYPSKPIVGFLLNKTAHDLHGGWGSNCAAARLHNAGFIIVDSGNTPVALPEEQDHLIIEADRIRLYALHYHIEPARERGARQVSIHARDVATALALQNSFPSICSALGGRKMQQLAGVPKPSHSEPNPSSSTTFTYQLIMPNSTTNLILYGPPGTGKTYATAWEAVRLCAGDATAEKWKDDREGLMTEYHRLADEGRIEFVTFHQSFSYEEFVEGLRPTTEGQKDGAGFRLEDQPGILRRIAEKAKARTSGSGMITLEGRKVYKMSLGNTGKRKEAIVFDQAIKGGYVVFGYLDKDWSDPKYGNLEEILKAYQEHGDRNETYSRQHGRVQATDCFRNQMDIDDIVIVSKGNELIRAIGKVTGDYEPHLRPEGDYGHRRAVQWLWIKPDGISSDMIVPDKKLTQRTIYSLPVSDLNVPVLERYMNSGNNDFVLIIDEINRANISKVFGELITILEPDKRLGADNEIKVTLPYSGDEFGLPANLHIIGTMNTADRSIALLDTALRRRFTFRELMPDEEALDQAMRKEGLNAKNIGGINLVKLLTTINERIEYLFDREHQIGHAYFMRCHDRAAVEDVMRHKIIPLLSEYFYEDWSKVAAVLGDRHQTKSHFLEAKDLLPPAGLDGEERGEDKKLRWSVKAAFDFSEFKA